MVTANVDQAIQNNTSCVQYAQGTLTNISSALIKNRSGSQVLIDWSDLSNNLYSNASGVKAVVPKNQTTINSYYGISTKGALTLQTYIGGKIQRSGKWVSATQSEIQQYLLPSTYNINTFKYQFLNLEATAGISKADAKAYLSNKGILKGKEEVFLNAAKTYNINEIYLMAHACLETGNGASKLATGVSYKGTVVYNMFGIKAYDRDPIGKGAEYAYQMGWTTPEKAIMGGAKFISDEYINNDVYKQDTLYEMRWNPASPGTHQYATDIQWATKQSVRMEQIYKCFTDPKLNFDIPVYRK